MLTKARLLIATSVGSEKIPYQPKHPSLELMNKEMEKKKKDLPTYPSESTCLEYESLPHLQISSPALLLLSPGSSFVVEGS